MSFDKIINYVFTAYQWSLNPALKDGDMPFNVSECWVIGNRACIIDEWDIWDPADWNGCRMWSPKWSWWAAFRIRRQSPITASAKHSDDISGKIRKVFTDLDLMIRSLWRLSFTAIVVDSNFPRKMIQITHHYTLTDDSGQADAWWSVVISAEMRKIQESHLNSLSWASCELCFCVPTTVDSLSQNDAAWWMDSW